MYTSFLTGRCSFTPRLAPKIRVQSNHPWFIVTDMMRTHKPRLNVYFFLLHNEFNDVANLSHTPLTYPSSCQCSARIVEVSVSTRKKERKESKSGQEKRTTRRKSQARREKTFLFRQRRKGPFSSFSSVSLTWPLLDRNGLQHTFSRLIISLTSGKVDDILNDVKNG